MNKNFWGIPNNPLARIALRWSKYTSFYISQNNYVYFHSIGVKIIKIKMKADQKTLFGQ